MTPAEERAPETLPVLGLSTVAVLVGVADWPYGYYTLLRLLLCVISLFFLIGSRLALKDWERWLLGSFVVLYNPLIPIRLGEKAIWTVLNLLTVGLFWFIRAQHGAAPKWVQRRRAERRERIRLHDEQQLAAEREHQLAVQREQQQLAERERQIAELQRQRAELTRLERWQEKRYRQQ